MSEPLQRILPTIKLLGETANLKTAREAYEHILGEYKAPQELAWIYYQYGALHWTETGDGTEARRLFKLAIQKIEESDASAIAAIPYPWEAYSCENLALLSLSFEECDRWADRLQRLAPQSSFLQDHRPIINSIYESGQPWSKVMLELAHSYCDPEVGAMAYGKAAAIFQLMLKNRESNDRDLRLSREIWGATSSFYAAVIVRLVMACAQKSTTYNVDEYIFVAQNARPLVEQYINEYPNDREGQATYEDLMQILKNAAEWKSASEAERESRERGNKSRTLKPFAFAGLLLGVLCSLLLAPIYRGKSSIAETNLTQLLTVPMVILLAPLLVGFITGIVMQIFDFYSESGQNVPAPFGGEQTSRNAEVSAIGFLLGIVLGGIAAIIIFSLTPFTNHNLFSHILFGVLIGGTIGALINPLSTALHKLFS